MTSDHYTRISINTLTAHTESYISTLIPHHCLPIRTYLHSPLPQYLLQIDYKMSTTPSLTQRQDRAVVRHDDAEHEQGVSSRGQENSDSDFSESPLPKKGGNTDNKKLAVEDPAVEKRAAEQSVVEGPGGNSIPNTQEIGKRFKDVIMNHRQGLRKMYGETEAELNQGLKSPIIKGETMARMLIAEMGCPRAIAKDLTVLTLYDVAILIGMF